MIVDTGANEIIIRTDLAHRLGEKLIWTPPCVTLQTLIGDKINVRGIVNLNIAFGNCTYHHVAYVAEIIDPYILGLDFLRENNYVSDFKNNELHSIEDVAVLKTKCEDIKPVHQVTTKCHTTIPQRTETILPENANEDYNFRYELIEYPSTDNSLKGVLVASSLVDFSRNMIPVRVVNVADKAKVLMKTKY